MQLANLSSASRRNITRLIHSECYIASVASRERHVKTDTTSHRFHEDFSAGGSPEESRGEKVTTTRRLIPRGQRLCKARLDEPVDRPTNASSSSVALRERADHITITGNKYGSGAWARTRVPELLRGKRASTGKYRDRCRDHDIPGVLTSVCWVSSPSGFAGFSFSLGFSSRLPVSSSFLATSSVVVNFLPLAFLRSFFAKKSSRSAIVDTTSVGLCIPRRGETWDVCEATCARDSDSSTFTARTDRGHHCCYDRPHGLVSTGNDHVSHQSNIPAC